MVCGKVYALFFAIFLFVLKDSVVLLSTNINKRYIKGRQKWLFINVVYHFTCIFNSS